MRVNLAELEGQRITFSGVFDGYDEKYWYKYRKTEQQIILKDIKIIKNDDDKILIYYVWLRLTKGFEKLGKLRKGEIIQFEARVKSYLRGYLSYRQFIDLRTTAYKLSHPTKVKRLVTLGED